MTDLLDTPNILSLMAEGRAASGAVYASPITPNPTFRRMVVIEVVLDPDPSYVTPNKIEYWKNVLGVSNSKYAGILPRNTIIAQFAYSNIPPMFVFPFFPSHLSLPCKAGECVWAVIEDPNSNTLDMAYWMCRITEPHNADDVNHTHAPRAYDPDFSGIDKVSKRERELNDGRLDPRYELRNGVVTYDGDLRKSSNNKRLIVNTDQEDIFESLTTFSDASFVTQYEAVPRFKKRPGDVVLEGSNNSLIVLGTDRVSGSYQLDQNEIERQGNPGPRPLIPQTDMQFDAGSIDIVVGRGQTKETFGSQATTTSINGATANERGYSLRNELAKSEDLISPREGDPDLINDRSRIQISQKTSVDSNFGLDVFNEAEFNISDSPDGDSAIVVKTDKLRLIARSDIEIIVKGFKEKTNSKGRTIKDEYQEDEDEKFAAIVIKSNGDIVFKPSDEGYIKLGDDNADRALLCTDTAAVLLSGSVSPATPALSNTMGGRFGGTGITTQGTWASKVLVTGAR